MSIEKINFEGKNYYYENDQVYVDSYDDVHGYQLYADGVSEDGEHVSIMWDYVEPDWYKALPEDDDRRYTNDLSDFADWDHPLNVEQIDAEYQRSYLNNLYYRIKHGWNIEQK